VILIDLALVALSEWQVRYASLGPKASSLRHVGLGFVSYTWTTALMKRTVNMGKSIRQLESNSSIPGVLQVIIP
jgi:hypothetical protein